MSEAATTRPTLVAVAARAGVSASTASLAFSGAGPVSAATRERVLAAAAELGYAGPDPRAASLRRGRSGIVGVVLDDELADAFRDPINIAMLDGMASVLTQSGAAMLLLSGDAAQLASAPVDAVVLVGCSPRVAELVDPLHRRAVPVVAIEAARMAGVGTIDLDNRDASRAIAQHLRDLGHERVAIVALPADAKRRQRPLDDRVGTVHTTRERVLGVRDVFPDAPGVIATGSTIAAGHAAGAALLDGSLLDAAQRDAAAAVRPTAIVAQSDLLAIGVIRAARERGIRVPDDLSVAGFDGVRLDGLADDDLTTMVQPATEKGRAAASAALALVDGGEPVVRAFTSALHVGATTAVAPAHD